MISFSDIDYFKLCQKPDMLQHVLERIHLYFHLDKTGQNLSISHLRRVMAILWRNETIYYEIHIPMVYHEFKIGRDSTNVPIHNNNQIKQLISNA